MQRVIQIGLPAAAPEPGPEPAAKPYRLHRRFDRIARLVGDDAMAALQQAHVTVFGCGGVGSFTAEALVRSGVGRVSIVDFDLVCATNANRQLHTLKNTAGKPKVEVMGERLQLINPAAQIDVIRRFYNAESSEELLWDGGRPADFVVDAIDNMTAKTHLIRTCRDEGIPLVVCCGAAARMDPTRVKVADLAETVNDPFAKAVRKVLRHKHGFANKGPFGIEAVFSDEPPIAPSDLDYDKGEGFRCVCPQGQNDLHSCEHRNQIDGSAGFVTGTFGLVAASVAVRHLASRAAEQ